MEKIRLCTEDLSMFNVLTSDKIKHASLSFNYVLKHPVQTLQTLARVVCAHGGFIAGGYARQARIAMSVDRPWEYALQRPDTYGLPDVDLYFSSSKLAISAAKQMYDRLKDFEYNDDESGHYSISLVQSPGHNAHEVIVSLSHKSKANWIPAVKVKFQFMTSYTGDPMTIFNQYDFVNAQVAITRDEMIFNENVPKLEEKKILSINDDSSPCLLFRMKKYIKKSLCPDSDSMALFESRIIEHCENQRTSNVEWAKTIRKFKAPHEDVANVFLVKALDILFPHLSDEALFNIVPYYIVAKHSWEIFNPQSRMPTDIKNQIKPLVHITKRQDIRRRGDRGEFDDVQENESKRNEFDVIEHDPSSYPSNAVLKYFKEQYETIPPVSR